MIRIDVSLADLKDKVTGENDQWLSDAGALTDRFRAAGTYEDHTAIWRRIVKVYMRLQNSKCAFCERKLEGEETGGTREFDVEHFRPKSSVKAWPPKKLQDELPDGFPVSQGSPQGYFLLPYHLYNYTVSCKPCNQGFKSNYFPIAGPRKTNGEDPRQMKTEKPYLLYPLGRVDLDPEKVIRYEGALAVPVTKSGVKHNRAIATIVFFGLNTRAEHIEERAGKLAGLYLALEERDAANPLKRRVARTALEWLCSARSSHTNCMRSFRKLYESDKPRAEQVIDKVAKLLETTS